jgi:hypothetical protein
MKYIVIGNTAVLATRTLEAVEQSELKAEVLGVPDGAVLSIQSGDVIRSYAVEGEAVKIPYSALGEGVWEVTVLWNTKEGGVTQKHEARGNPFKVQNIETQKYILHAPLATATDLEYMWSGIVNALEVFVPLIDTLQNGNDVV